MEISESHRCWLTIWRRGKPCLARCEELERGAGAPGGEVGVDRKVGAALVAVAAPLGLGDRSGKRARQRLAQ